MSNNKKGASKQAHQSGDAWTAYSDLFTTLSVIFLMMFVFTLVRLTINSVRSNKEKREASAMLEGKVPEEVKKKTDENKAEIAKSIDNIQEYRNTIQKRVQEMNQLVVGLEKHQKIADQLLEEQKKSEGNVAQMRIVLQDRNKKILDAKSQILELSRKLVADDNVVKAKTKEVESLSQVLSAKEAKLAQAQIEEAKLNEQVQKKNQDLSKLNQTIQTAQARIQAVEAESKVNEQRLSANIADLKNQVQAKAKAISESQQQVTALNAEIAKRQAEIVSKDQENQKLKGASLSRTQQIEALKEQVARTEGRVQDAEKAKHDLVGQIQAKDAELRRAEAGKESALNGLRGKLAGLEQSLQAKTGEINGLKGALASKTAAAQEAGNIANGLRGEIRGLNEKLAAAMQDRGNAEGGLADLRGKVEGLSRGLAAKEKQLGELQAAYGSRGRELAGAQALAQGLGGKLAAAELRIETLSKGQIPKECPAPTLANQNSQTPAQAPAAVAGAPATVAQTDVKREPAQAGSSGTAGAEGNGIKGNGMGNRLMAWLSPSARPSAAAQMRSKVAEKIATRINGIEPLIKADAKTGSITLFFDEAFLFGKDKANVERSTQDKLKKIIPIYTEELLSDAETREQVSHVNIIGHASPSYGGKFANPKDNVPEAYYHNLQLSANRAINIVKYIFGRDFPDFKYRKELRERVNAQGASFSHPILKRSIASTPTKSKKDPDHDECGEYDCQQSRRVEISFELKGEESR